MNTRRQIRLIISCLSIGVMAFGQSGPGAFPDNVNDSASCFGPMTAGGTVDMRLSRSFGSELSTYLPALVGDLDGDGHPDIVIGSRMNSISPNWPNMSSTSHAGNFITVIRGPNHASSPFFEFQTVSKYYSIVPGVIAIARVPIYNVMTGIIAVAEGDNYLRAYNAQGVLLWTSSAPWTSDTRKPSATTLGFADFNNDGIPEIYSGNRIFDARNGQLLCMGSGNSGLSYNDEFYSDYCLVTSSFAADVFGDSRLELICGNQVYQVAQNLSSMSMVSLIAPPACIEAPSRVIPSDGYTRVADFNGDGRLEVLVERWLEKGTRFLYLWSPATNTVLAQKLLTNTNKIGLPVIGDIDGRRNAAGQLLPEITFVSSNQATNDELAIYNKLQSYQYVAGNTLLQLFWSIVVSDPSGMTGVSLFDFNNNGINEIVYRDVNTLHIINGSKRSHMTGADTTAVYDLAAYSGIASGTGYEYPVVVDIDNDGEAEILITGGSSTNTPNGRMHIFKSNTNAWAPTRHVWNQYSYAAVNVNDDLTIPSYQFGHATIFAGADGIIGTADDVQPFNAIGQQPTFLSTDGLPYSPLPDLQWGRAPLFTYNTSGDSLNLTIWATNLGSKPIGTPVYFSVYAGPSLTTLIDVVSYNAVIAPNQTITFNSTIQNLIARFPALSQICVRLNDNARTLGFPYYVECDTTDAVRCGTIEVDDCAVVNLAAPCCLCADEGVLNIEIVDSNMPVTKVDVIFDDFARSAGFENVTLNAFPSGMIRIPFPTSVRPNNYSVTLHVFLQDCKDPVVKLFRFQIKYPNTIMEQNWNNVIALLNEHYDGYGFRYTAYQWYRNNLPIDGATRSYYYLGTWQDFDLNDEYSVLLTREDDGVTLMTCPFRPIYQADVSELPTIVIRSHTAFIVSRTAGRFDLYDTLGRKHLSGVLSTEGATTFLLPTAGIWLIVFELDNGLRHVEKIVSQNTN